MAARPGARARFLREARAAAALHHDNIVAVHHVGAPPQLFQECIPVVVEGRWRGTGPGAVFDSHLLIVAHDSNYEAENSERIAQARREGMEGSGACLMDRVRSEGP